jgi:hypothetical protein
VTTSLNELVNDIATALEPLTVEIPELQVYAYYNPLPTPPSIDVYPSEPFQEGAGFGVGQKRVWFTVRARVNVADPLAGSQLLLQLLDANDAASVEAALAAIDVVVDDQSSVSGFRRYSDDQGDGLLGCEWRVGAFL